MSRLDRGILIPVAFSLALVLPTMTGCLLVSKDLLPPLEVTPAPDRPFVEYQISPEFRASTPGGGYIRLATSTKIGRGIMNEILGRWKSEGYISDFAYINPKQGDFTERADLQLFLGGTFEAESSVALQIVSGLTLMVIPAYGERTYDAAVTAVRTDVEGSSYQARAKDGIDEWVQILLLPATPFFWIAQSTTYDRMSAHLYQQLKDQGAFGRPLPEQAIPSDSAPGRVMP